MLWPCKYLKQKLPKEFIWLIWVDTAFKNVEILVLSVTGLQEVSRRRVCAAMCSPTQVWTHLSLVLSLL